MGETKKTYFTPERGPPKATNKDCQKWCTTKQSATAMKRPAGQPEMGRTQPGVYTT